MAIRIWMQVTCGQFAYGRRGDCCSFCLWGGGLALKAALSLNGTDGNTTLGLITQPMWHSMQILISMSKTELSSTGLLQEDATCACALMALGVAMASLQQVSGLALVAYEPGEAGKVIMRRGKRLGNLHSSFSAEMLALEWALDILSEVMHNV